MFRIWEWTFSASTRVHGCGSGEEAVILVSECDGFLTLSATMVPGCGILGMEVWMVRFVGL